jgi:hypothetical protein
VSDDSRTGWNQLWVDGERVLAYVAPDQELFEFDLEGRLQRRTSLAKPLAEFARDQRGNRARVVTLVDDSNGSLLAQIHMWTARRPSLFLARLPLDGSRPQGLEAVDGSGLGTTQVPLVGKDGSAAVFFNRYTATILRR